MTGLSRNAARIELTPQCAALVQAARRILKFPKYQYAPVTQLRLGSGVESSPAHVSGLDRCRSEQLAAAEALKADPHNRGLRLWLADQVMEEVLLIAECFTPEPPDAA